MPWSRLPVEPGPFIGRVADLRRLDALIASRCRVITVVGPGGMGKTRLSVHWASEHHAELGGGAHFVDLGSCRDDTELLAAIAATLEVPIGAAGPTPARVAAQIAGHGRALVILDNFEQLVAKCATTVQLLADGAPEATFLVTSREPLRIAAERVLELVSIGLPDVSDDAAAVARTDAYRLFHDRVEALRGSFDPDPQEVALAGTLVRRLDGIPLAIELAASRLATVGTRALLTELARGIDALGAAPRGKPGRHRTLRAAIDGSIALLSPDEARAFTEIGVFEGGLDVEAAAAILSGPSARERLEALREKALVRSYEPPQLPGTRRLAPYETIGAVARERLEAYRGAKELRLRHARHYAAVARDACARIETNDDVEAQRTLAIERDNFEAALDTLLGASRPTRDAPELAAWLVLGLEPVRLAMGTAAQTPSSVARLRKKLPKVPAALEARLLEARAHALDQLGRRKEAVTARDEALALARKARDRALEGRLLWARAHGSIGPTAGVLADVEHALSILREHGLPRDHALAANELAVRKSQVGDLAGAEPLFLESVRGFRAIGDRQWEGVALCQLGILRMENGRADEARAVVAEAVRLAAADVGWNVSAMASQASGHLAHLEGDLETARAAFERAIGVYRRVAHALFVGIYLGYAGMVERERGALDRACALFEEACGVLAPQDEKQHRALFLAHWGATLAWRGDEEGATARLSQARALAVDLPFPGVALVVEIEHAHLDLAAAARADADRDPRAASAARKRAADRLDRCVVDRRAGTDALVSERIARRALGAVRTPSRPPPPPTPPRELAPRGVGELVVERDARWLALPDGTRVGLASRHLARRLLRALVDARLLEPGARVSHATLIEAGWPGERMRADSARNRLYVAMSTLRKLGLERILESEAEGYRLDPDVPLRLAEGSDLSPS